MSSQIYKLYDNTVQVNYQELTGRHRYLRKREGIDSKFGNVAGVTTVIKEALNAGPSMTWPMWEAINYLKEHENDFDNAAKAYLSKSDYGKNIGSEVHRAIEMRLTGKSYEVSADAQKAVTSAFKWLEQKEKEHTVVLGAEKLVYSLEGDYAGKFDLLMSEVRLDKHDRELSERVILADYKTTNKSKDAPLGVYWSNFVQLGGYAYALSEMEGTVIDDLAVINIGKDGKVNTVYASDLDISVEDCSSAFIAALNVYRFKNKTAFKLKELTHGRS